MTVFYGPDSELNSCLAAARKHCQLLGLENIECKVANYLYPDCKVIAGNNEVCTTFIIIILESCDYLTLLYFIGIGIY